MEPSRASDRVLGGEERDGFRPHPITNMALFLVLTVLVFHAGGLPELGILAVVVGGISLAVRVRWRRYRIMLVPFLLALPVSYLIFVGSFLYGADDVSAVLRQGALQATLFNSRLGLLLVANLLFIETTELRKLTGSLRRLHVPEVLIVLLGTVLTFFPLMVRELGRILEVQRSRGLRTRHLLRPGHYRSLVIPLLLLNMQRAHDLAVSMELRGVRTRAEEDVPGWNWKDGALAGGAGVLAVCILMVA